VRSNKGAHLVLGLRRRHALADQQKRTLRRLQYVEGVLDVLRHRHRARRVGASRDLRRPDRDRTSR
jgi:hypothetical protein